MRRQKPEARLLCYASIIVLSLSACSHHGGKLKSESNIPDNAKPSSTADNKKSRFSQNAKNGGRWFRKKDQSPTSRSGKGLPQYDNLWERLFDLYDLPPIEHEEIDHELVWFVNHPSYIDRVQNRAEPFLYSIVKQVEKHDIPGEIALLPVIESAFQPHAVSPANAAGIWQFIPSTGRIYGLKRSRTYDGRRDIYASTKAAIKYLKKLHSDFNGDWLLAIAAYNCGEGAVARAIQKNMARNMPTDFWSLDLPQETRSYVPRLLAVAKLFADADQYGIDLHEIPNSAQFKPVKVSTQIDLALAADAADMPLDKLYELNPGFKGPFTDVEGSYHLFIPAEKKTSEFKQELQRLVLEGSSSSRFSSVLEEAPVEAKDSTVASAELAEAILPARTASFEKSFSVIPVQRERREPIKGKAQPREKAAHHRERAEDESKSQLRMSERSRDRTGMELGSIDEKSLDRAASKKAAYTVQRGETLWAVARKHSVDVELLAKWNNFSEKTAIKAGQTLVVWNKDAAKKLPLVQTGIRPSQSSRYKVREGDTLFSISRRFNVSVADLRKWNGSKIEKQIQPGKNITVQLEKD